MSLNPSSFEFEKTGNGCSVQLKLSGRIKVWCRSCRSGWSHHERRSSSGSERNEPRRGGTVKAEVYRCETCGFVPGAGESAARRAREEGGQDCRMVSYAGRAPGAPRS